jgi:hypothetical protein
LCLLIPNACNQFCACRKNTPGALVLVDGQEITRERKLLAWAADMSLQRSELRRTRMELAQAREEIRVLRAELSVLRMEVRGACFLILLMVCEVQHTGDLSCLLGGL